MSKQGTFAAKRSAPFAWLGPLAGFAEFGTAGYPRAIRRRLTIVNLMALTIAIFSVVYAGVFAFYGVRTYWPLIAVNIVLTGVALLAPLAHRFNDIAAALLICIAEFIALFFFVRELGHDSGIQINFIIAAAVAFAVVGLDRIRLVVSVIATGLALHVAAWFLFPPERAQIAADPSLLANLYISSAATTFTIIALIVGYAFTVADRARAEADALLANILPEAIAERLKAQPGDKVADNVGDASVLFTDLVGFTELAQRLGVQRTVALLDQIVTAFDRLAAAHGVEKIKTIGDGYMAVAGVSRPQVGPSDAARPHGAAAARSGGTALRRPWRRSEDPGGDCQRPAHGRDHRQRQILLRRLGGDGKSGLAAGIARASRRDPSVGRGQGGARRQLRLRAARGDPSEGRRSPEHLASQEGDGYGPARLTIGGARFDSQPAFNGTLPIGSLRTRTPVAAKIALVTAGKRADVAGSPMPPGASSLSMIWTSIAGTSLMNMAR